MNWVCLGHDGWSFDDIVGDDGESVLLCADSDARFNAYVALIRDYNQL